MADSIFTKIINREIKSQIEYEDDEIIAINDINPKAPVHILIIPKKPIPTLNDITEEDTLLMGKIIQTAKKLAKEKSIDERGYRLVASCNHEGGQEIYHLHFHLLGGRQLKFIV